MPNTIHAAGPVAQLMWGYHKVATLRGWTVDGSPGAFTLKATMADLHDFWISQRPLEVVTPNGWRWTLDPDTLQITGETLIASIRSSWEPTHVAPDSSA